jgi:hypothetical protein
MIIATGAARGSGPAPFQNPVGVGFDKFSHRRNLLLICYKQPRRGVMIIATGAARGTWGTLSSKTP